MTNRKTISTYEPSLWTVFKYAAKDIMIMLSFFLAIGFGTAYFVADRYVKETQATLQVAVQENQQLKVSLADAQVKQAVAEARLQTALIPEASIGEVFTNHVTTPMKNGWKTVVGWFSDETQTASN